MLVQYNTKELDLLARIMRAEALDQGNLGMLMVGNVVVNRCIASCLTFKNVRTLTDAIYQKNQFVGTSSPLFQSSATTAEKNLAKRVITGEYYHPATHSLWFYSPGTNKSCKSSWFEGQFAGSYKDHCFYRPPAGECPQLY